MNGKLSGVVFENWFDRLKAAEGKKRAEKVNLNRKVEIATMRAKAAMVEKRHTKAARRKGRAYQSGHVVTMEVEKSESQFTSTALKVIRECSSAMHYLKHANVNSSISVHARAVLKAVDSWSVRDLKIQNPQDKIVSLCWSVTHCLEFLANVHYYKRRHFILDDLERSLQRLKWAIGM
ncbi:hypothetical protein [Endozoicomonas ascidiicola]|uniref:hypothetical protein n=1 Tax=Endozoicomonas ascidiicola TaxID=1698521 RepID=UPI00082AD0B9|nr:hypothetical protein [Endozoicomonas ascidiicola]